MFSYILSVIAWVAAVLSGILCVLLMAVDPDREHPPSPEQVRHHVMLTLYSAAVFIASWIVIRAASKWRRKYAPEIRNEAGEGKIQE